MNYLSELKRRNVFKVAIAYLALGWVVVQITDIVVPALNLPESLNSIVVYIGIVGFPFALFFTWAFELTPEGMKRTTEVDEEHSIRHSTGQKINYIIIGLMAIAIAFLLYDRRAEPEAEEIVLDAPEPASTIIENAIPVNSIAVLPFVNMSSDPEQEYFSDGISEEILNVLAQIKDLRVTSRSSSFSFKGQNIDTPTMAKQLGVSKILEGSVRKSGNRIRITAQLIEAETDIHLWSETYDRDLSDIFAVQDEISKAIVEALKTTLNIDVANVNFAQGTSNIEAHNEYLLGLYFRGIRTRENHTQAKIHFEKATELDPNYAESWARISVLHRELSSEFTQLDKIAEQQLDFIKKAESINPDLAEVQLAYGFYYFRQREYTKALSHYERAMELNPNEIDVYTYIAQTHQWINNHIEAHKYLETAVKIDPMSFNVNIALSNSYKRFDQFDKAQALLDRMMLIHKDALLQINAEYWLLFKQGQYVETIRKYRDRDDQEKKFVSVATATALTTIGLHQEAAQMIAGNHWAYHITEDYDDYIKHARATWPVDGLGGGRASDRARAEIYAGNYQLAKEIIQRFEPCAGTVTNQNQCQLLYYAERKSGDTIQAAKHLQKLKVNELKAKKEGWTVRLDWPSDIFIAKTLAMSGETDKALIILKEQLNKGFFDYKILNPLIKELHDHPDWPAFLSDVRSWQAEQQAKLAELNE